MAPRRRVDAVREKLRFDTPYYAENLLQIVNKRSELVPLVPTPWQARFDAALEEQRAKGLPMRAINLKARKLGFSTWVQAKIMQRVTQQPNSKALVVAQDNDTAMELFEIGERMYRHLPDEADLKPPLVAQQRGRYMKFGEPSRALRAQGDVGIDSSLEIDTAKEVEAGRGYTYRYLHLSEVAFWRYSSKLTALLNAVPDEPETLVVLESTANGHNHFKARWDRAVQGEMELGGSRYIPFFAAWHEDPDYALPFDTDADREAFAETIGEGPFGEDEPRLVEQFGCTPEQLAWRRWAIVDKCEAKVEIFHQEYPSSPDEAFISSGRHVFSMLYVNRVLDRTAESDPELPTPAHPGPDVGILKASATRERRSRSGTIEVPTGAMFVPRDATGFPRTHPFWRIFEQPTTAASEADKPPDERREPGQYVIAVDPAGGEENDAGDTAYHAIEVVNHRTLEQVAEYASRVDPDQLAAEAFLVGLLYNSSPNLSPTGFPWLVVETTGLGMSTARKLWFDFGYSRMYFRPNLGSKSEKQQDRLGWDTNRRSKPQLEADLTEQLREQTDGIRSRPLARQLTTYVRDERGRTGPESSAFSDRLMAYMLAQTVAREKPLAPTGTGVALPSTATRPVRDTRTGY